MEDNFQIPGRRDWELPVTAPTRRERSRDTAADLFKGPLHVEEAGDAAGGSLPRAE